MSAVDVVLVLEEAYQEIAEHRGESDGLAEFAQARRALEVFLEDVDAVIEDLHAGSSIRRRLVSARSRIGAAS